MKLSEISDRMGKVLDILRGDLGTIRTGRAAPSILESVSVLVYGGSTRLKILELATIAVLDSQTLTITPFDPSIIDEIKKGILESNIGLTPVADGALIRISIPPLSEERRRELIKPMKQKLESGRVMVRQIRHDGMGEIKKEYNDKAISEDELLRLEKEIQRITDDNIALIEDMGRKKEEELLLV